MAEKVVSKSKYALKVAAQNGGTYQKPHGTTRPRRFCDDCGLSLAGRRGHGFPNRSGRRLSCGSCSRPGK